MYIFGQLTFKISRFYFGRNRDGMQMEIEGLPLQLAISDPFVLTLAASSFANAEAYRCAVVMGCPAIEVYRSELDHDFYLLYPRGAFGECKGMDKAVFWAFSNALDRLKSAYMDLDDYPEMQKRLKAVIKEIDGMKKEVDQINNGR